jgi:hypothetical protein
MLAVFDFVRVVRKKPLRALFEVLGSGRNPLKSMFVV